MKKRLLAAVLAAVMFFLLFLQANCADIYAASGAEDVFSSLDETTLSLLEQAGLDIGDPASILRVSPAGVVAAVLSLFTEGFSKPIASAGLLIAALVLYAILEGVFPLQEDRRNIAETVFLFFFALQAIAILSRCMRSVYSALETVSLLMRVMIPVMGGIAAASGAPLTSSALTVGILSAAEGANWLVDTFFVPVTGLLAAICILSALPDIDLQQPVQTLRKLFAVTLGGVGVLFNGVLALQGAAAKAGDSVTFRSAKFLVGGLVPVVGSAIGDGLSAAVSDSVGVLGIAAIAAILLPSLVQVFAEWFALYCCVFASSLLGQKRVVGYLSGIAGVLSLLNTLLLFDGFVFICAVGVLIAFV